MPFRAHELHLIPTPCVRVIVEVASFQPGKAVTAEPECLPPPFLKVLSINAGQISDYHRPRHPGLRSE